MSFAAWALSFAAICFRAPSTPPRQVTRVVTPTFSCATTVFALLKEDSTPEVWPSVVLIDACSSFRVLVVTASA